jgi:hypothetical protein
MNPQGNNVICEGYPDGEPTGGINMKKRLMVIATLLILSVLIPTVRFASAQDASDEHLSGDAELAQELSNTALTQIRAANLSSYLTVFLRILEIAFSNAWLNCSGRFSIKK